MPAKLLVDLLVNYFIYCIKCILTIFRLRVHASCAEVKKKLELVHTS